LGGLSASREKELGTVTGAYAARVRAVEWVVGKALPYIAAGLAQFVVCFAVGRVVFGYSMPEHPAPLLVSVLVYILAAVFYGMLVGHATGNQSAAIQGVQFGAFLFSLLLSGFITPLSNAPAALQAISNVVPARHFVEITRDVMLRGGDWGTSGESILKLGCLAMFFFAANVGRMRRMRFDA
jgi:ABC-2 type transport system permease protein